MWRRSSSALSVMLFVAGGLAFAGPAQANIGTFSCDVKGTTGTIITDELSEYSTQRK